MAGPMNSPEETALWQRWRRLAPAPAGESPDALTLAAYAEGRLGPGEMEVVEDWLSANPDLVADVASARNVTLRPLPEADAGTVARAVALVAAEDGRVVSPRRPTTSPGWQGVVRWSAMAASVLIASVVGFALGNDTYVSLAGHQPAIFGQELLDPPSGLFTGFEEDTNI
jgi:anti-sigma factor RsiW